MSAPKEDELKLEQVLMFIDAGLKFGDSSCLLLTCEARGRQLLILPGEDDELMVIDEGGLEGAKPLSDPNLFTAFDKTYHDWEVTVASFAFMDEEESELEGEEC
jgi:hypothetical protein